MDGRVDHERNMRGANAVLEAVVEIEDEMIPF